MSNPYVTFRLEASGYLSAYLLMGASMLKVGDKVTVQFTQHTNLGGTVIPPTTVEGKIVEEKGDNWVVELAMSFDGKNRIFLPKSAAALTV